MDFCLNPIYSLSSSPYRCCRALHFLKRTLSLRRQDMKVHEIQRSRDFAIAAEDTVSFDEQHRLAGASASALQRHEDGNIKFDWLGRLLAKDGTSKHSAARSTATALPATIKLSGLRPPYARSSTLSHKNGQNHSGRKVVVVKLEGSTFQYFAKILSKTFSPGKSSGQGAF